MAQGPIELHAIPYARLFPWVRLFRAFHVATDAKKLLLAAVGLALLHAGWAGIDRLVPRQATVRPAWPLSPEAAAAARTEPGWTFYSPYSVLVVQGVPGEVVPAGPPPALPPTVRDSLHAAPWRLTEPVRALVGPFLTVFDPECSWPAFCHAGLSAVWGAVVWGLIGGAIVRIAVVQVARGERVGTARAVRFALGKGITLVGTPLSPLLGVAFFVALCALFGLLYRIPGVGPAVAGALAVLPLLAGLVLAVILIGLALGWPLMPAAVAAEGEDGFDAVSRSYAYVNQRRGHYLGYVVLAWLIGAVGLVFVDLVTRLVVHLTHWSLSFGAPQGLLGELFGTPAWSAPSTAARLHAAWLSVVGLLAHGWIYSYFWSAAAILYLLLRHDVDGTPFDEVRRDDADTDPFTIPPEPAAEPADAPAPSAAEPAL